MTERFLPESFPMVLSMHRLRVGFVGLGRRGRFHLQRISLRNDIVPVARGVDGTEEVEIGEPDGCRIVSDCGELFVDEDIDVILVTGMQPGRLETVRRALDRGRSVALPSPLTVDEAALVADGSSGPRLLVLSDSLADDDFRVARDQVQSGRLGEPRALAHTTWGFVGSGRRQSPDDGRLPFPLLHRLEQFLLLTAVDQLSVSAHRLAGSGSSEGIGVRFLSPAGMTARIEYHPSSPAPLASGWMIAGTEGGYRDFEVFSVTDDEEVYGTPLASTSIDLDSIYDDLLVQWNDDAHRADVLRRAVRLTRLVEAVRVSLVDGVEVTIDL